MASNTCHNCGRHHLPAPCPDPLAQCIMCRAFGHLAMYCPGNIRQIQPAFAYVETCHNCGNKHLPITVCPLLANQCEICHSYGHLERWCPLAPAIDVSIPATFNHRQISAIRTRITISLLTFLDIPMDQRPAIINMVQRHDTVTETLRLQNDARRYVEETAVNRGDYMASVAAAAQVAPAHEGGVNTGDAAVRRANQQVVQPLATAGAVPAVQPAEAVRASPAGAAVPAQLPTAFRGAQEVPPKVSGRAERAIEALAKRSNMPKPAEVSSSSKSASPSKSKDIVQTIKDNVAERLLAARTVASPDINAQPDQEEDAAKAVGGRKKAPAKKAAKAPAAKRKAAAKKKVDAETMQGVEDQEDMPAVVEKDINALPEAAADGVALGESAADAQASPPKATRAKSYRRRAK